MAHSMLYNDLEVLLAKKGLKTMREHPWSQKTCARDRVEEFTLPHHQCNGIQPYRITDRCGYHFSSWSSGNTDTSLSTTRLQAKWCSTNCFLYASVCQDECGIGRKGVPGRVFARHFTPTVSAPERQCLQGI